MTILLLIFSVPCIGLPIDKQKTLIKTDSLKTDSSQVYRDIETFSKQNAVTTFVYSQIFKPVPAVSLKKKRTRPAQLQLPYTSYEGKIVRDIIIVTEDPFGYSTVDTAMTVQHIVLTIGNTLHVKTQYVAIENLLLIHRNELFDSILIKESARLIRSQSFVREASFSFMPVEKTADSVDVYIRVIDKWSIVPVVELSTARVTAGLTENNFAGFGHDFQYAYTGNLTNGKRAFTTMYAVPNIRNTFITTALRYTIDEDNSFSESIDIERPFFSPLARSAAGLTIAQVLHNDTVAGTAPDSMRQNVKYITQDYWAGYAHRLFDGKIALEPITNAIIAARYLRVRFSEKPDALHDSIQRYSDEDFCLLSLGISAREYVQDHYIFDFGGIEDVPVGNVFCITGGYQIRNNSGRGYSGVRLSFGDYNEWGYFSSTVEYGTFFPGPLLAQGVFAAGVDYFSNLIVMGNWHIRQFIKPQITWGTNRSTYDSLTINDENGIRGFNSTIGGTSKITVTLQTQSYPPWNVWGFRFGPYLTCALGMLGTQTKGFENAEVYSQIGIGTLIKNNYLVFSDFQISVSYYPSIPGSGYSIFKLNAFKTADFGFRDFSIGKPAIVAFQ